MNSTDIFEIEGTTLVKCDRSVSGEVVIPEGVTKIGDGAFRDRDEIKSIVIPDSVTKIGAYAFAECSALESIVIPNSVTKIGAYAFAECFALKSIVIPDSVTEIGTYAFVECSALKSIVIPDSVTEIGAYAFFKCSALKSIVIPDSVTEIGYYAFFKCSALKSIVIPDSVTKIGYYAFYECFNLKRITIVPRQPNSNECDRLKAQLVDVLGDRKDAVKFEIVIDADLFQSEIDKREGEIAQQRSTIKQLKQGIAKKDGAIADLQRQIKTLTANQGKQTSDLKKEITNQLVRELVDEVGGWSDNERFALNSAILNAWPYKLDDETMKAVRSLKKPTPQGPSTVVQGDFVGNKNVENQVNHVASGATGITSNKSK